MKKMMSVFFALVLSSMAFANAPVDIKFEGTSSGIEVSVTGANQDKSGKNDNTVKVYKKGSEVASFKLSNGSGSTLVQGVKCDEQIVVTVFNVQNEDGGKGGKHTETSKLRRNYSGSNCPKDSEPTPPPKKKTNISLSATGTASGVEVTITGVDGKGSKTAVVYDSNGNRLGQMEITHGTSTQAFDGVSCDESVYAVVLDVEESDGPNRKGDVKTNSSSVRSSMAGTNCNTAPAPRPTEPSSSEVF